MLTLKEFINSIVSISNDYFTTGMIRIYVNSVYICIVFAKTPF